MGMTTRWRKFTSNSNETNVYAHKERLCMKMSRRVPLNAMRVFDAVARTMSFTKAGEELGMTQTAVSYQIKLLEETLGTMLFLRHARRIELTEAGARMVPKIAEAFGLIEDALLSAGRHSEETLVISTTPTFAGQWLAQRIGRFQLTAPNIAVRLLTTIDVVDFSQEPVDLAIRSGGTNLPGLTSHMLMKTKFAPMTSPALLEKQGPIKEPRDLLRLRLIDPEDPWWTMWFRAVGVDDADLSRQLRSRLGSQTFEASVAIAGQGVAILTPHFYADEVSRGLLVQPFPLVCEDDSSGYWLVYPDASKHKPKIRAFRDWLLAEFSV
jgi:LysR family transcriptional regulator, glycine cleavage system transcriptional activator